MKKIVIPIDFSECSLNAVRYAEQLASILEAELHIVYVHNAEVIVAPSALGVPYWNTLPIPKAVHDQMSALKKTLKQNGEKVKTYIKEGVLPNVITELAIKKHADLVVMGTEGVDFNYGSIWGSHTSEVIEEKKIPVLVVPKAFKGSIEQNAEFVLATDFKGTECIPTFLVEMAKNTRSTLNVFYNGTYEENILVNEFELNEYEYIKDMFEGVNTRLHHSAKGNLIAAIDEFNTARNSSLVIMIAHQRHFLENLFHKSATKQMALYTKIPFLAIPDELVVLSVSSVSNSGFVG